MKCCISSGSTMFVNFKAKKDLQSKDKNYNLAPLDVNSGLSQGYCIKPEGRIHQYIKGKQHNTVKPVLSGHSIKDQKFGFKTDYRLMQVKSIAECSKGSILQYFRPSLSYYLSLISLFCLFLSGRLKQVSLYKFLIFLQVPRTCLRFLCSVKIYSVFLKNPVMIPELLMILPTCRSLIIT